MGTPDSITWSEAMEVELARLEVNLHFIVDYSSLMHLSAVGVRAEQCLSNIKEIKQYLQLHEQSR